MMKKYFFGISVFFISILIAGCSIKESEEYASIAFMIGDVKKNNSETKIGDIIKENDTISTGGDKSSCDIKIGKSIIRIKAKSSVKIASLIKNNRIEDNAINLDTGKVICKIIKNSKDERFIVKTPTAIAAVRGTQFIVEADKKLTTSVKVFQGEVNVAKRVKQFESSLDTVLTYAPVVQQREKVIITADDVQKAERIAENSLKKKTGSETPSDEVIDRVISDTKNLITVNSASIVKFDIKDFTGEDEEIIKIANKPKDVIARINRIIVEEKERPLPEGRLLVTNDGIYFIKDGQVQWEGNLLEDPVKDGNRLYIAAGDYLFCVGEDGPVLWKIKIKNPGKITIVDGKLKIESAGQSIYVDPDTGKRM